MSARRRTLRRAVAAAAVLPILIAAGCATGKRGRTGAEAGAIVGVYRGTATSVDGESRKFRMRLYVELPDRIHAELSGPVGGPKLIVDGGGGRIAVSIVPERVAFVGGASRDDLARALGLRIALDDLVPAFLGTAGPPADVEELRRGGGAPGELPERFLVRAGDGTLELVLKGTRELPSSLPDGFAAGTPAPRMEPRPLSDLAAGGGLIFEASEPE